MGRRSSNYPPELWERAVRMVAEVRPDYPSDWPAIVAVAQELGIGTAETLRKWSARPHHLQIEVLRRPVESAQYTSIAFTERLAAAGVSGSAGTARDAHDNALAESVIGLFKTELIKPRGPWRTAEQVEIATLEYVDWHNRRRLYQACGDIPPAELETAYYHQNSGLAETALSQP